MTKKLEFDRDYVLLEGAINDNDVELFQQLREASSLGNKKKAKKILELLLDDHRDNGVLRSFLANIFWDLKDYPSAETEFLNATHLEPTNEMISVVYFHFLLEAGRDDEAFDEIRRFVSDGGVMGRYKEILTDIKT